jgi:tetratricopeptide (TPR) repeat protein
MARSRALLFIVLLALCAAGDAQDSSPLGVRFSSHAPVDGEGDLLQIPKPNLAGTDQPVQTQIQNAERALSTILAQSNASGTQKAKAFGMLGEIYQAYEFGDAALATYANAAKLQPQSFRWHYYLAYLSEKRGDADAAVREYRRALALKPNDGCAMLRLAQVELELSNLDTAKSWLRNPAAQRAAPAAAITELGKVALAEHQYQIALKYFTEALAIEPKAASIHYQLAKAYRALGDLQLMQENLRAQGDGDPTIHDPLLDEISAIKQSRLDLWKRGNLAMNEKRFSDAVAAYSQMVSMKQSDPIGYLYLAEALAGSGQREQALEQYAHALQLDPNDAVAHYNMGILLTEARRGELAMVQFREAIRFNPEMIAAHWNLANLLMRRGKDDEAGQEYGIVVAAEPQNGLARLMQAMAAVQAKKYAQARFFLEQASQALPDDPDIADALARVLSAAPYPDVRDETRGLQIIETVIQHSEGMDFDKGVTLGMALAGVGRFQDAIATQRGMIGELEKAERPDLIRLLQHNLALYEHHEPCRIPWESNDPIFAPVLSEAHLVTQIGQAAQP